MDKPIASLALRGARNWTDKEAAAIAEWLREKAKQLLLERDNYSNNFHARYYRGEL